MKYLLPEVQDHRLEKESALQRPYLISAPEAGIAALGQRREKGRVAYNVAMWREHRHGVMHWLPVSIHHFEMHPEDNQPPIRILRAVRSRARRKDEARAGAQFPGLAVEPHHPDPIHDVP